MKLTIIGTGYVGLTTGLALATKKNNVVFFDIDENKINSLKNNIAPFYEKGIQESLIENKEYLEFTNNKSVYNMTDIFLIAVPTPEKEDGSSDLKYVEAVIKDIFENRINKEKMLLVIKSTVPIGTNRIVQKLVNEKGLNAEVASNPEFLSQGSALHNSLNPTRIVIGVQSEWAKNQLHKLYEGFSVPVLDMSLESAEMVKYASNTFRALKISFANELANLAEEVGSNINDVTKGMGFDPVIGSQFLGSGIGYGGSCFPKDTKSLAFQGSKHNIDMNLTNAIIKTNESQIVKLADKVLKEGYKKIGILGLTFKPGTDDTRETPAHYIIERLNENGIVPVAYDPQGTKMYQNMFKDDKLTIVKSAKEVIEVSDVILLVTEWKEFIEIKEEEFKGKKIFDGRRIYDFAYYQIGRGYKK